MGRHVGIVGCSAPGAALCYETLCMEGTAHAAENAPTFEVSMHTHPSSEYLRRIGADAVLHRNPLAAGRREHVVAAARFDPRPGESGAGKGDRMKSRHAVRSKDQRGTACRA